MRTIYNYKNIFLLTLIIAPLAFIAASCGDDTVSTQRNNLEFSSTLKPLDAGDGIYEAWISISSSADHGDAAYKSAGRFNVTTTGALVDANGNPTTLNLNRVTNINDAEDAIITIEAPGDNDTIPGIKILGGAMVLQGGAMVCNMTMGFHEVLPAAEQFASTPNAKYLLATPTEGNAGDNYTHGVWFSQDTTGSLAGLFLPVLPDTAEWIYQGWVIDMLDSANRTFDMGRFRGPAFTAGDGDICRGPLPVWNLPGSDWITANCPVGTTGIDDLSNGNYRLLVTLEPKFESSDSPPFYLKLFYGNLLSAGGFGTVGELPNTAFLPTAVMKLTVR